MKRLALVVMWLPVAALLLLVVGECAVRALYTYAMWRTERFPLLYERVYWGVPPWVQYMSVLRSDPEIGLCMKPHAERTYMNLYGPIGDVADVEGLFASLFPPMPTWPARREPGPLSTNALGFREREIALQRPPGSSASPCSATRGRSASTSSASRPPPPRSRDGSRRSSRADTSR